MSGTGQIRPASAPARRPWMLRLTDRPAFDRFRTRRARRIIVVVHVGLLTAAMWLAANAPPDVIPGYVWVLVLPAVLLLAAATGGTSALYDRYLDEQQQAQRDAAFRRLHPVTVLLVAAAGVVAAPALLAGGVTPGVAVAAVGVLLLIGEAPSLWLAWRMPDEHGTVPRPVASVARATSVPERRSSRLVGLADAPLGATLRRPLLRQPIVALHAVTTLGLAVGVLDEPVVLPGLLMVWLVLTLLLVVLTGGLLWRRDRHLDERLRGVRDRSYFRGHLGAVLWPGVAMVAVGPFVLPEGVDATVLRVAGAYAVVTFAVAPAYVYGWMLPVDPHDG